MGRIKIDFPEPALYEHRLPIRITDINYASHLAHDVLVSILHEARARFFLHFGMREESTDGVGVIITDLAVVYKGEVFYEDVLRIEIAVEEPSAVGCDFKYRVSRERDDKLVALAKTGILFFDFDRRHIAQMPPTFRRVIGAD